jgi:hypothetical protein
MKETLDGLEQVIIHHFKRYSFTSRAWQQLPTRDRIEFLKDMRRDMEKVLAYKGTLSPNEQISKEMAHASDGFTQGNPGKESKTTEVKAPAKSPAKTATKTTIGGKENPSNGK